MFRSNTRLIRCLQLLLAVLVAAPFAHGQMQGPNPTNQPSNVSFTVNDPVTEQMTNTCNGETVDLSGVMIYKYHQETHPNGDVHIVIESNENLSGTGETTQAKYKLQDTMHSDFKFDQSVNLNQQSTQNYTENDKVKLVAQGPTPDLTIMYSIHWRINQQGIEIVRDSPVITKCSH
jgi:hypothetical protein